MLKKIIGWIAIGFVFLLLLFEIYLLTKGFNIFDSMKIVGLTIATLLLGFLYLVPFLAATALIGMLITGIYKMRKNL